MGTDDEIIVGLHAVAEALAAGERLRRIIIGQQRRNDPALKDIVRAAADSQITIEYRSDAQLRSLGADRYQHVAAVAPPFGYVAWPDMLRSIQRDGESLVVAIDHVEDPHNLGAILRNAEAAGAAAAIIPERRSAMVTPAARRSAAGAASHLAVSRVTNLTQALKALKGAGHWIIGASLAGEARPYTEVDLTGSCTIVIGSEGRGLSRLVAESCDLLARIPLHGRVASLNASAAAAVLLFEAVRQRAQRSSGAAQNKPH
ncbi:MAG: 23S rRNA (guanosine(2251)-2'-O)-methyltransferase RlmB [Candidatus Eremiobacteraeota bacterium]|nr:23S rRNA (guanosine(2251)-2'-O)-methyltransferase RlmB [Candidatus Eremiobacteraeota bacterium]MBC5826493.1 23S rRNA (guanosine(2251)-2'-O)-methyltransferase RlmB [Candidatus Eremiobacteraeota bacterium]